MHSYRPPAKIAHALHREHPRFYTVYDVSGNSKHNIIRQIPVNTAVRSVALFLRNVCCKLKSPTPNLSPRLVPLLTDHRGFFS